ncbi:hypothetical protein [Halanaerobium congolense]|nr:hypothetical protein [Halanaerobium congolense]
MDEGGFGIDQVHEDHRESAKSYCLECSAREENNSITYLTKYL